jgi:hypothetical protein
MSSDARALLDTSISEAAFQRAVIELAQRCGYLCAHFRPARTATGWRTPVEGDGAGFPDLILSHATEPWRPLIVAELKTMRGTVTPEQRRWLDSIADGSSEDYVIVRVWRPVDWPEIELLLKGEWE